MYLNKNINIKLCTWGITNNTKNDVNDIADNKSEDNKTSGNFLAKMKASTSLGNSHKRITQN